MPGMGDEIEGAMQHAPHCGRHSIAGLSIIPAIRSSLAAARVFLPAAGSGDWPSIFDQPGSPVLPRTVSKKGSAVRPLPSPEKAVTFAFLAFLGILTRRPWQAVLQPEKTPPNTSGNSS